MQRSQPLEAAKACFVSYRHTRNEDAHRYVQSFVRQLRKHLSVELPNVPIFFDEDGIKVGTQFHDELAFQLYRSACLVLFFSPQHFDSEYVYCALEYQAMVGLEEQRRELYADQIGNMSMILPVVFRGRAYLPAEIESRTPLDFTNIVVDSGFEEKPAQEDIMRLAQEIAERYRGLSKAGAFQDTRAAARFRLPDEDSVRPWIQSIEPGAAARETEDGSVETADAEPERELDRIRRSARSSVGSNDLEAACSEARKLLDRTAGDPVPERSLATILFVADSMFPTLRDASLELLGKAAEHSLASPEEKGESLTRIAEVCRRHRALAEALEFERRALDRYGSILGTLHVVTLEASERVANDMMLLGDTEAAFEMREQLVERRRDLANDLFEQGDARRAREQLECAFEICRRGLGPRARLAALVAKELTRAAAGGP